MDEELRKILVTLFHSYSPSNETLAINEAEAKIMALIASYSREARIDQTQRILELTKQTYMKNAPIANIENITNNVLGATNSICITEIEHLKTLREAKQNLSEEDDE